MWYNSLIFTEYMQIIMQLKNSRLSETAGIMDLTHTVLHNLA